MKKFKLKRSVNREIWNDGRTKVHHYISESLSKLRIDTDDWVKIQTEVQRLFFRFSLNVYSYINLDVEKNAKKRRKSK